MKWRWLVHIRICAMLGLCLLSFDACTRQGKTTPMPTLTPTLPPTLSSATASPTTQPVPTATQPMPTATPTVPPQPSPTPPAGPVLCIGWVGVPQTLNPMAEQPSKADTVLALIYDRLVYRALDNSYTPALATNWSSPDGGKTWVFSLQPNIKAHDGQLLDSEDVAFSLNLVQNHYKFRYTAGYTLTMQVQATSSHSLTITLSQPAGNIEALVHWIPLMPKRVYESGAFDAGKHIGSGPFILQDFQPGQAITLTANPNYWGGAPRVGAVVFRNYASVEDLAAALKNGQVDVITDLPPSLIAALKSDAHIQVVTGPQIHFHELLFNVSTRAQSTGHPALKDKQVRLAIAYAIDKQQLIDVALVGRGMPGLSIIPPVLGKWFNAAVTDVPFDPDKAKQILESAGYKDTSGDGIREMPGGSKSLNLRLFISSDSATGNQEANMIVNWLRQIGIEATFTKLDPAAMSAATCPACNFDLMLWERDGGPDPGFLLSTLTTAQIESGLNRTGYSNPTYDALYAQQANTVDQDQRRLIVQQMQQMAFDERPCIVLYYDLAVQAFRKDRFRNWLFVPNGALSLLDVRSLLQVEPVPQ